MNQEQDDFNDPAVAAVDKLTTTVEKTLSSLEERIAAAEAETKAVSERADELEAKLQRPGRGTAGEPTVEQKAFATYLRKGRDFLDDVETKTLRVANDVAGGYITAPAEFVAEIIKNVVEFSPVRQVARVTQISSGGAILPKRTGRPTGYWVDELEDQTATEPTYGSVRITAMEAAAYVDVSNKLIEDSAFDVSAEVAMDLAEEFGRLESAAFVNGSGVKQPVGFMTDTDVAYTASGGASGFASSNPGDALISLYHGIPTVYAQRAVWGMNRATMALVRQFKDGQGRYLWQDNSLQPGMPPSLLGRPVVEMPDMDNVGSNTFPIVFGSFSDAYRILDRVSLSMLRDPFTQAAKGVTRFYARRRVGGAVVKAEAIRKLKCATS